MNDVPLPSTFRNSYVTLDAAEAGLNVIIPRDNVNADPYQEPVTAANTNTSRINMDRNGQQGCLIVLAGVFLWCFGVWATVTLLMWITDSPPKTLIQKLADQWHVLSGLRIW